MKIQLAEYVANFLVEHNITDCFSVVGGGAMYLNNALGHNEHLKVTYNHHEQACAIAAEAYARLENKIAAVCVTTGPGGINALNGVACGWLDSIPMMIISGQVRYDTTARYAKTACNINLRSFGDQEYDIVSCVEHMTKYAVMIEDPLKIRYVLEKAYFLATTGRPGPVWIDIPLNFQSAIIDTNELEGFSPEKEGMSALPEPDSLTISKVIEEIKNAKRPVLYAGYGIRLSKGYDVFRELIEKLNIPVVTYWNAIDLIENEHGLYCGRGGNMGDRPGNFAVQNADLILAIGTRISIRQVGYNWKTWAREAKVIMVDVDENEMKKPTLHVDLPIHSDAKLFMEKLLSAIKEEKLFKNEEWISVCNKWKNDYPVVSKKQYNEQKENANVYAFIDCLSNTLPENSLTAVSNGACCVAGSQAYKIKKASRFINNSAIASMGYGLPAAIGMCLSAGKRNTVCLEGDGSIMMNLQELQTIITNNLPIKIFLINNAGYHSIRQTQNNLFSDKTRVGIGPESHDLSFPDFQKLSAAFGYNYYSIKNNAEMLETIQKVLKENGPVFCEVFTDTEQNWEPKSSTKKLGDGRLFSPPLEDLAPFLPREELEKNMFIKTIEQE